MAIDGSASVRYEAENPAELFWYYRRPLDSGQAETQATVLDKSAAVLEYGPALRVSLRLALHPIARGHRVSHRASGSVCSISETLYLILDAIPLQIPYPRELPAGSRMPERGSQYEGKTPRPSGVPSGPSERMNGSLPDRDGLRQ